MILLEDKQREIVPFGLRELSIWAFWYFWVFVACALYFPFLVLFSWPHILRHHYMFVVFTATLGLDLFLKEFFSRMLSLGESIVVIEGFFSFTLVHNKGAAFGLFKGLGWFFVALAVLTSVFIFLYLAFYREQEKLISWSLVFILAGALGNMIDRIRFNHVVDYLDFYFRDYRWPVFNLADVAINVGVFLLLIDFFRGFFRREETGASSSDNQEA
jgi:signal peptidase II